MVAITSSPDARRVKHRPAVAALQGSAHGARYLGGFASKRRRLEAGGHAGLDEAGPHAQHAQTLAVKSEVDAVEIGRQPSFAGAVQHHRFARAIARHRAKHAQRAAPRASRRRRASSQNCTVATKFTRSTRSVSAGSASSWACVPNRPAVTTIASIVWPAK